MRISFRGLLVPSLVLLTACSTFRTHSNSTAAGDAAKAGAGDQEVAMDEASRTQIDEDEVSSEDVELNIEKPYKSSYGEIPLDHNAMVDRWIRYFQGKGRSYMEAYLERSTRYLPMMKNVLRENGLPEDLVYIALIESGFSPTAYSHANAVGYWQFIRSTGRRFGLKVDAFTDERRDPVLSTRAAADYFKALYGLFGSWHLAMAAYNVGELRVKRAVTHYYTRDFWKLVRKRRSLPAETKQYVPKFIAATLIAKDPKAYGFTNISYQDPLSYDTVTLKEPISLTKLASNLNVDTDELQLLNPKFRTDYVPVIKGNETVIRIPVGRGSDALAALSLSVSTQPKVMIQPEYIYYRIRRGDNLSMIAHRHHTTVSSLRRLNHLSNRTLLRIGHRLRVPDPLAGRIRLVSDEENTREPAGGNVISAVATTVPEFHRVRRGENLSTIARRYGISIQQLLRLNHLHSRSFIRRGQRLRVREESYPNSARHDIKIKKRTLALGHYGRAQTVERELQPRRSHAVAAVSDHQGLRRHTVRRGETLYDLSKKYGVSLSELARVNNVKVNYRVVAGERLFIPD